MEMVSTHRAQSASAVLALSDTDIRRLPFPAFSTALYLYEHCFVSRLYYVLFFKGNIAKWMSCFMSPYYG